MRFRSRTHRFRNFYVPSSLESSFTSAAGFGAGLGNVEDKMLPTSMQTSEFMFQHINDPRTVSIIGAPMTYGQPFVGTDVAPTILREAGLHQNLTQLGWRIEDMQDIDFANITSENGYANICKAKNSQFVGKGCQILADIVKKKGF